MRDEPGGQAYAVAAEPRGLRLIDRAGHAWARVEPERGNNVTAFSVGEAGARSDVLVAPRGRSGRNGHSAGIPVLFPFPNRVRAATYTFDGRRYRLDANESGGTNHIHGLVRGRPWRTDGIGAGPDAGAWVRASIDLAEHAEIHAQYPFPCTIAIETRLQAATLTQSIEVRNGGDAAMPFGYGIHPWFRASVAGASRAESELRVPARRAWVLHDRLPTGDTVAVSGRLDLRRSTPLGAHAYDDVLTDLVRRADGWSEAALLYPSAGRRIVVEASPEFREWVVYAPRGRNVVCLEPYTCTTDAVNLHAAGVDAGLIVLPAGGVWRASTRISVRDSNAPTSDM